MILPIDNIPEKSLYVIGSQVLNIFKNDGRDVIDLNQLYDKYQKKFNQEISFNFFLYALDWLYILNLVELTDNHKIKKCY